jgi:hypothetical protein
VAHDHAHEAAERLRDAATRLNRAAYALDNEVRAMRPVYRNIAMGRRQIQAAQGELRSLWTVAETDEGEFPRPMSHC